MKRIEYKLAMADGNGPLVTGYLFGIPGLAVRKAWGCWQIDHVESGYAAHRYNHKTRKECVAAALRADDAFPHINWTKSADVLTSNAMKHDCLEFRAVFQGTQPYHRHDIIFRHNGDAWSTEDFNRMILGNTPIDGICSECNEVTSPHEPDATDNWCPACERTGSVTSVLVLAGY